MKKNNTLLRLTGYVLKNYKWAYLTVMICILISSAATLSSTLFTKTLIDDYIVPLTQVDNPEYSSLWQVLFKLGLILALGVICSFAYNKIMIYVSHGTLLKLRKDMYSHMEQLPISYFDTHKHGDIMSTYTNDVDTLRQMVGQSLPQVVNSLITIVITFGSMLILSVPLSLVSVVMAVLMMTATKQLSKLSRKHFKAQQQSLAAVNGYVEEMVSGQKIVKVFCHEQQAIDDFEKINEQLRSSSYDANRMANIVMPVNGNLGTMGYVLIAVVGATLALGGYADVSLGTIVSFLTLNKNFTQPISHISQQINSIISAAAGAERVFDIIDQEPEDEGGEVSITEDKDTNMYWVVPEKMTVGEISKDRQPEITYEAPGIKAPEGTKLVKVEGGVKFDNADFSYTPEKQVLFDICIDAMPDQKIAFVGGTGAGKTTIINLITRFYDIQDGSITYDGIDIKDIKKRDLRQSLGMVLQETRLFTGTVMDNIRYGKLDATDEECVQAATLVGADDFIRRLADGYNTMLDGEGGNLSQGERQLIAIARTAIADPQVLILDEATSSIDTRTEQIVQQGMDSLMQGRTTFVIAHRLSTVRNSDMIIVMDHGRIIERGNHDELINAKGKYYQLYTGNEIN